MNPNTAHVRIDLGERSYDIAIGAGLIDDASAWQGLPQAAAALIVTNDTVAPLCLARLQASLAPHYPVMHICSLPDGESYKTWDNTPRSDNNTLITNHCLTSICVFIVQ